MKILVTGGAGFVGSNIVHALKDKHDVTVLDNLSSGHVENLDGFDGGILDIDVSQPFSLDSDFDAIIHEASITDTTFTDDEEMVRANVSGFRNVLKLALDKKAKLVYISSAGVYGNGETPMKESQSVAPLNAYSRSKVKMDVIAKEHFSQLTVVGLRYFNVFGMREAGKGASSSMIYQWRKQIQSGEDPGIFEDGNQKRDHIYVKDVVSATVKALDATSSGVYNVGTGIATPFASVLQMVQSVLGSSKSERWIPNPYTASYQVHTHASVDLATSALGYTAQWKLKEAIADYFAWLDTHER
ncbi:MAG: NAD-dependent epimerase/dehydratase family protein [Nanoarchaeota archaeon]|nr:NAD-dependent epimerase/dehydratase family protein [Nanoarchaeota archaeon]